MFSARVWSGVFALALCAFVWSGATGGTSERPPQAAPAGDAALAAETPPENPQDPLHQCRLGCKDSCKAFGNPALRKQCLGSCYSKCTATYGP